MSDSMRSVPLLVVLVCLACHRVDALSTPEPTATPAPSSTPAAPTFNHSSDALKKELSTVIEAQLAAFRADDYPKAYTFAAAEIKGIFPASDFEKMVRTNYPVIAKSTSTEYGVAFDTGDEAVVNVRIENAEKKSVEYQYLLKKEADGWKISGVTEAKAEGLSV